MTLEQFAVAAGIRAIKTFAQALIAVIGTGALGILEVDWAQALSVSLMAAVLSILTSIASMPFGEKGTPGLPGEDITFDDKGDVGVPNKSGKIPKQWSKEDVDSVGPVDGET